MSVISCQPTIEYRQPSTPTSMRTFHRRGWVIPGASSSAKLKNRFLTGAALTLAGAVVRFSGPFGAAVCDRVPPASIPWPGAGHLASFPRFRRMAAGSANVGQTDDAMNLSAPSRKFWSGPVAVCRRCSGFSPFRGCSLRSQPPASSDTGSERRAHGLTAYPGRRRGASEHDTREGIPAKLGARKDSRTSSARRATQGLLRTAQE